MTDNGQLLVREHGGGVRFTVRVQPRSGRDGIAGTHAGALKVRVAAAPVNGEANGALVTLLADRLGVPARDIQIVSGHTARTKLVEVQGVDATRVRQLANGR